MEIQAKFSENFQGLLEESSVTGRLEPTEAPAWKRRAFRYLVSFPIIGLCLLSVFIVMFLILRLQVNILIKNRQRFLVNNFLVAGLVG